MSQAITNILQTIEDFKQTAESRGLDLRLDVAEILIRNLKERNWSQRELANAAGMLEPQVSRILHSSANCTLDTIGRLMFALDIHSRLQQVARDSYCLQYIDDTGERSVTIATGAISDGQENAKTQTWKIAGEC